MESNSSRLEALLGIMIDQATTPHGTLGVAQDASDDEVRSAYIELAKVFHPDSNYGDPFAARRFKRISQAYNELKDFYPSLKSHESTLSTSYSRRMLVIIAGVFFLAVPALILILTRSGNQPTEDVELQATEKPGAERHAHLPTAESPNGGATSVTRPDPGLQSPNGETGQTQVASAAPLTPGPVPAAQSPNGGATSETRPDPGLPSSSGETGQTQAASAAPVTPGPGKPAKNRAASVPSLAHPNPSIQRSLPLAPPAWGALPAPPLAEPRFAWIGACRDDVVRLCPGVIPGGGRIVRCLAAQASAVSARCKNFIAAVRENYEENGPAMRGWTDWGGR